jgi:hypothetical protein
MKRAIVFVALLVALVVTACSSSHHGAAIPSLGNGGGQGAATNSPSAAGSSKTKTSRPRVGYSTSRITQLHAAAECIREHGIPSYQDPVLTADGQVYSDSRSIQDAGSKVPPAQQDALMNAIRQACGRLFAIAGLQPDDESPAPPQLVQAGVRSARCLRANGLPLVRDPTSQTPFTPGHGFGLEANELPNNGALGKTDPTVQRAFTACRPVLDSEVRASDLTALVHD